MAKIISDNSFVPNGNDKALQLNALANKYKKEGKKIINATVGMLTDEEGHLARFDIVDEIGRNSIDEVFKVYGPVNGGVKLNESIKKWLFENTNIDKVYYHVVASMGGTGALALSIRNYANNDQEVLVPSIRWPNYNAIIKQAQKQFAEYELFDECNNFNIASLKEKVNESCNKHNRAFVIINDPCQNPTGYTLSLKEWKEILSFLKEKSLNNKIVLLDDIAYINYNKVTPYNEVFNLMMDYLSDNFMIHLSFSASKTLSIYGYRGGALVGLSSSEDNINEFKKSCEGTARAIWSCPNAVATNIMAETFATNDNRNYINSKLEEYTTLIKERAEIFLKEASEVNLSCYPYRGGFFILIPCENNSDIVDKLIEKNIFVSPMCNAIRISISAITKDQIKGLAKIIKETI